MECVIVGTSFRLIQILSVREVLTQKVVPDDKTLTSGVCVFQIIKSLEEGQRCHCFIARQLHAHQWPQGKKNSTTAHFCQTNHKHQQHQLVCRGFTWRRCCARDEPIDSLARLFTALFPFTRHCVSKHERGKHGGERDALCPTARCPPVKAAPSIIYARGRRRGFSHARGRVHANTVYERT